AQYEENPYPRWSPPSQPAPFKLSEVVNSLAGLDQIGFEARCRTVLVAGCGTGYEPIDIARADPTLDVTAMDLSRTSLAYGARKARELGLERLRFVQGDILALEPQTPGFDIVTSTGVLHHMADPALGLRRLAGTLRPGGLIRIGLYSRRARVLIASVRDLIVQKGWRGTASDIRLLRAHLLGLPPHDPLARLTQSEDFFSISGCRDLFFHVHEQAYGPLDLVPLLETAGLRLVEFDASPEANALWRRMHGDRADRLDMSLWDVIEARNPDLFAAMFQLWAQKPGKAS
ncbi:hypothetical protein LTR94_025966, partial [Friedmanniomyces endolithicus]